MQTAQSTTATNLSPSRLRRQGFVNHYRKPLLVLLACGILCYLHFVKAPWKFSDTIILASRFGGMLLLFAGILGRTLATMTIGGKKDRSIACTELYSVCRNPLYFSSFLMALGIGMFSVRPDFALLLAAGYLCVFYPMMRNEAKGLRAVFSDFADYERRVPLFIPNFSLWQERPRFDISFKLVRRTLRDAALSLLVVPVILLLCPGS